MTAAVAPTHHGGPDVFGLFAQHNDALGGQPAWRRQRLMAGRAFLDDHPDLDVWMAQPVNARLVELDRRPAAWLVVSFAVAAGLVRADSEFLFAKNFGHSMARWLTVLFPGDVDRLRHPQCCSAPLLPTSPCARCCPSLSRSPADARER